MLEPTKTNRKTSANAQTLFAALFTLEACSEFLLCKTNENVMMESKDEKPK